MELAVKVALRKFAGGVSKRGRWHFQVEPRELTRIICGAVEKWHEKPVAIRSL